MLHISHIHEVLLQSCVAYGLQDLLVSFSYKLDLQMFLELGICLALLREDLPKHRRVAVCGEQSGVSDAEIHSRSSVRRGKRFRMEFTVVESVRDQLHGRLCHGLELLLHQRRHRHYRSRSVQHLPLHLLMPFFGRTCHLQVLEIEYLGPRIPEVCNPRQTGLLRETKAYHMH